jgi:predicted aconitase
MLLLFSPEMNLTLLPTTISIFGHLDAVTVLSRSLAAKGIYPAVDPFNSSSKMLDESYLAARHYNITTTAIEVLQRYCELQDLIAILGLEELSDLSTMLKGKSFQKRCMIFCSRAVQEQSRTLDYINEIERAGGEILSDCCTCLTPLIVTNETDAVTTNSIKGAYYLNNSTGVNVNLKPLTKIIEDETK